MAKVIVVITQDWRKICELAGGDTSLIMHDPTTNELEVTDVTQGALDTALADYIADQTNIDAATQAAEDTQERDNQKEVYDVKRVLRGLVEALVNEINLLRQQFNTTTAEVASATNTTFNDRTVAQARAAILNAIDSL